MIFRSQILTLIIIINIIMEVQRELYSIIETVSVPPGKEKGKNDC